MRRVTRIAHCRSGAANLRFQLTTAKVTNNINNITANLQKPNRKGHKKETNGYPWGLNRRGSPVLPAKRATVNNGFGQGSRSGECLSQDAPGTRRFFSRAKTCRATWSVALNAWLRCGSHLVGGACNRSYWASFISSGDWRSLDGQSPSGIDQRPPPRRSSLRKGF
jgi:hypothetical protein